MSRKIRAQAALPLALAGFLLLAGAAVGQAPDTFLISLDLVTPSGGHLVAGPLAVPDPILPNPAYDALSAMPEPPAPLPLRIEDNPDGLYVLAANGAPIEILGWTDGLEQRQIAPVEFVANALDLRYELPVNVDGHAGSTAGFAFSARLAAPHALADLPADGSGVAEHLGIAGDEVVPRQGPVAIEAIAPAVYQGQMAAPVSTAPPTPAARAGDASLVAAEAVAVALAAGAALLALKLLLPLYHRFKKKTALDNPTRAGVYELLRDAPGSSAAELGERAGLHVTTVKYHLDVLRRVGLVGEQTVDGRRRFFSYENGDRVEMLSRALLDEPAARAVYRQIETHPGLPFIEVARSLGMRKEHVHYHVQKLARHGLIADKWEGGRRLLFIATPQLPPPPQATEVEG